MRNEFYSCSDNINPELNINTIPYVNEIINTNPIDIIDNSTLSRFSKRITTRYINRLQNINRPTFLQTARTVVRISNRFEDRINANPRLMSEEERESIVSFITTNKYIISTINNDFEDDAQQVPDAVVGCVVTASAVAHVGGVA